MPPRKNFRVRVRGKVRNRILRRGGAAAGVVLAVALFAWVSGESLKASRRFFEGRLTAFRPDSVSVRCPAPEAAQEAARLLAEAAGTPLTAARCRQLAEELRRRHPGLSGARVSRNFVTGRASLEAEVEKAVAPVLSGGTTQYLGESGRLMAENLSGPLAVPFDVELRGGPGPAPELVSFLREVYPLADLFPARPRRLTCERKGWDCELALEDGTTAAWGGFEFARLKILRLSEVLKDAASKRGGPFRVDLRCFSEGKIYVSAARPPSR